MDLTRNAILSFLLSIILIIGTGLVHRVPQKTIVLDEKMSGEIFTPTEYRRDFDQTFLTFPEWYLVHSPREFAQFTKNNPPSNFPFFGHVMQFWQSYYKITKTANETGSFNSGYHLMIMVIGTSTTAEYLLRGTYELLIGKVTAALSFTEDEDLFAAKAAQDYVDFIEVDPWYKFDFYSRLTGLWTDNRFFGKNFLRKLERKYVLSTDYFVKWIYGKIIWSATDTVYDAAIPTTAVVIDKSPVNFPKELPEIKPLDIEVPVGILMTIPRYQLFTDYALALAKSGVNFVEIAGNRTVILFSAILPADDKTRFGNFSRLFEQEIMTQPELIRVAFVGPVADLAPTLLSVVKSGGAIEHIYDY